jgi:hypothetical protein
METDKKQELQPQERELLLYCLNKHEPKLLSKIDSLFSGTAGAGTVNEMRDAIGLELMEGGFDSNNFDKEVNEYGVRLENLIDRLADLYWPKNIRSKRK